MPPGGPADTAAPALLAVAPDSGSLNVRRREALFRFDEVVSERPRGAQTLDQLVVISPSEGPPAVDWRRQTIAVRPRRGWRANTAYTVTILPGLTDLHGNAITKPLHTVFSTGSVIPSGVVRGVVFDWLAQRVASGARIEAMMGQDTTLRFVAAADSAGRYALGNLPAGVLVVRAFADQNGNRVLDARETWDSVAVALADSARNDFYLFAHDSLGPRLSDVSVLDSMRLRARFDRPLQPSAPLDASHFTLRRTRDSVEIRIARALPAAAYDSVTAARKKFVDDSVAKADTTAVGQRARARADSARAAFVRDSTARAQMDAVRAARDTVKREPLPKPARPAPVSELVLELAEPLPVGVVTRLEVQGATGLAGTVRSSVRDVPRRAAPADSAATKAPPRRPPR